MVHKLTMFVLCMLLSIIATAQKPLFTPYDKVISGSILVTHVVDFEFTEKCMTLPYPVCHEGVLPPVITQHESLFAATELSFSAAQFVISYEMRKHGHRKLARMWDMVNLTAFTGIDVYVHELVKQ